MKISARLTTIRERIAADGLDYLLVTQPENRRYLSGFADRDLSISSSAGWLLIGQDVGYFLTSFLYLEAVRESVRDLDAVRITGTEPEGLAAKLAELPPGVVGFEPHWLTYQQFGELASELPKGFTLKPTDGLVEEYRQIKDAEEIAALEAVAQLTDDAYQHVVSLVRVGMTEKQVAWEIERYIREHGGEGLSFPTLVAAGPHSAVPHHSPTDRPLGAGEPIWIDMGALLNGYCGDLTRSFCLERADGRFQTIYQIVDQANKAASAGLRAGLTGVEGDALARRVIVEAGYPEAFAHSLGHGIGLAIHEGPRVSRLGKQTLRAGMVTSIEPGIYLSGWGGVRIEDVAVIAEAGVRVLTHAPKQVIIG